MPSELYLIRHGISENQDVVLGQCDPPLSAAGRRQAEMLARQLQNRGIGRIFSSALRRSIETAEQVAAILDLDVTPDTRLNEISYGRWDGLSWEEIEQRDPGIARAKVEDWWGVTPEGGEPFKDFYERVRSAFLGLSLHSPTGVTAVVAHVGVNAILAELATNSAAQAGVKVSLNWNRIRSFSQQPGTFERVIMR